MIFNEEQLSAIKHIHGPMMVIAGPGSGKTTVITHRIKYMIEAMGVSPEEILVITFTKAAANEMSLRFKQLTKGLDYSVRFGTFHSIFFWIIKTAYQLDNSCVISENEKRVVIERIMNELCLDVNSYGNKEETINNILAQISKVKCDMLDIDSYYSKDMLEEEFRTIYKAFDRYMRKSKKIDFDDMLVICYDLLTKRRDILARCQKLFRYILVDEFQDSNKIQYEILKLLSNSEGNVFVVGDDDQSVYGFRGARPDIMHSFKKDFSNTKVVYLDTNYRSDQAITKASSVVIADNTNRFPKKLKAASINDGKVTLFYPEDSATQNDSIVAKLVENYRSGIPYENQAVLYRLNMQPRRLVYKLEQYGIPFSINDSLPNLFEHFAVKTCIDYVKFALGNSKRSIFLRIMNKPIRYITRDLLFEEEIDLMKLKNRYTDKVYVMQNIAKLQSDLAIIKKMKPFAALNYIRKGVGYEDYLKKYSEEKNLDYDELIDLLDEFAYMIKDIKNYEDMFNMISKYQESIKELAKEKNVNDGVKLMTMHSSKGLEFDVVFIIDAVEGVCPYKKAKTKSEKEEERRMFYVAMTRAKHELNIYAPKMVAGKLKKPSPYIR